MRAVSIRICLALTIILAAGQSAWPATQLVISSVERNVMLACVPLAEGGYFSLEFINSIYLAPVRETYRYEPPAIAVVRVDSPSAGVFEYYGLETDGTGTAELHRTAPELILRSHDYTNHLITVGTRQIYLKGLIPDGEAAIVRVRIGEGCGP
jgi:hypothetical protein